MTPHEIPRMLNPDGMADPVHGQVRWAPVKSLWFSTHALIALVGSYLTLSLDAMLVAFGFTVTTLCLGHSVGLHRLLIHRSFECPRGLEVCLIHLGTLVGMGGPFRMLYLHDIRDWSQRHESCHPFFIHRNPIWKDFLWQLHCDIRLTNPPKFQIEPRVAESRIYQWMDRTWMGQQLPWALGFFALGGVSWLVWGISVRITVSLIGHWLIGYFAHNSGSRDWHLEGHAVQGFNLPHAGLLTMGESWHNNHHAFPGSARLGLDDSQVDPGWWALCLLQKAGWVWNLKLPKDLPKRPELSAISAAPVNSPVAGQENLKPAIS